MKARYSVKQIMYGKTMRELPIINLIFLQQQMVQNFLRRDSTPLRSLRQQRERDAGYRRQPAGAARKTGCNQRRHHHRACFRRRPRPGMLEASVCDRPHRPVESIGSASIPQRRNGQNSSLTAGTAGIARQRPSDKQLPEIKRQGNPTMIPMPGPNPDG